jgi:hypothetical protein
LFSKASVRQCVHTPLRGDSERSAASKRGAVNA